MILSLESVELVRIYSQFTPSTKFVMNWIVLYCCFINLVYFIGRGAKEANLYTEIAEGMYSYGITRHRHGKLMHLVI